MTTAFFGTPSAPNSLNDSLAPIPTVTNSIHTTLPTVPASELDQALGEATRLYDDNLRLLGVADRNADLYRDKERELTSFQEQVREALVDANDEGWISEQNVTDILEALDLPGLKRTYNVEVTVKQSFTLQVEAASEDEAGEIADDRGAYDLINSYCDDYSWELEVDYVQEA